MGELDIALIMLELLTVARGIINLPFEEPHFVPWMRLSEGEPQLVCRSRPFLFLKVNFKRLDPPFLLFDPLSMPNTLGYFAHK